MRLDDLAHGQPLRLTLTVEPERKGRSTQQNRLMWSLLTIMADAYNLSLIHIFVKLA